MNDNHQDTLVRTRRSHRRAELDRDEEVALVQAYRGGDRQAGDRLLLAHVSAVARIAHQYRGYGIPVSDLAGEGNVGLIEALTRFDETRGIRFFTYARHWVRAKILAYALRHSSIVVGGTGARQSKLFFRLRSERARLVAEHGSDDGLDGLLAEQFQTSEEQIRESTNRLGRSDASLDAPVGVSGFTLGDLITSHDDQAELFAQRETEALVQDAVSSLWKGLDKRERMIIRKRLLVDDPEAATLEALGSKLGVTRERVRQIETGVKSKLREALAALLSPRRPAPGTAA